jgi:heterodisulfide reductase subunit A-like polyferredoxin
MSQKFIARGPQNEPIPCGSLQQARDLEARSLEARKAAARAATELEADDEGLDAIEETDDDETGEDRFCSRCGQRKPRKESK